MIVFVGGMPRSGSTFSFNVVKELLEKSGSVYFEVSHDLLEAISRSNGAKHVVLKSHYADNLMLQLANPGGVKIICTIRRVEDAIASAMSVFDLSVYDAIMWMRPWLEMFRKLPKSVLLLSIEDIEQAPDKVAVIIAEHLGNEVAEADAAQIGANFERSRVKAMSDPSPSGHLGSGQISHVELNSKFLLHERHVDGDTMQIAQGRISDQDLNIIRQAFKREVDAKGYPLMVPGGPEMRRVDHSICSKSELLQERDLEIGGVVDAEA